MFCCSILCPFVFTNTPHFIATANTHSCASSSGHCSTTTNQVRLFADRDYFVSVSNSPLNCNKGRKQQEEPPMRYAFPSFKYCAVYAAWWFLISNPEKSESSPKMSTAAYGWWEDMAGTWIRCYVHFNVGNDSAALKNKIRHATVLCISCPTIGSKIKDYECIWSCERTKFTMLQYCCIWP